MTSTSMNAAVRGVTAPRTQVLLSERLAGAVPILETQFADVAFVTVPVDGPVLPEYLESDVLWISNISEVLLQAIVKDAKALKWVQIAAAGFDWIMSDTLQSRIKNDGVEVTRSVNSFNLPIAEHVLGAMISGHRQFPKYLNAQHDSEWIRLDGKEVSGSTVAIFGTGAIGQEVAWRCNALGATTIGVNRTGNSVEHFDRCVAQRDFMNVLGESDTVVLATPLTEETRHMFCVEQFAAMKPGAILINVGRGAVVCEKELVKSLEGGMIAGAFLDVFETEPVAAESNLWATKNLVITPHSSFRADGNLERLTADFRANLSHFLGSRPLNGKMKHPALGY